MRFFSNIIIVVKGKNWDSSFYMMRFCVIMKKNFVSVKQIENFYETRRLRNEQSRRNYYKAKTTNYLNKVDPETWVLDKYVRKYEKYKIANANKIEREKRHAIQEFEKQLKKWIEANRKWSRTITLKKESKRITKSMAKEEFQLFCKISRADEDWIVTEITTWKKVHRRETQWWHFVSASINQTCFDVNNVRPQFWRSNKQMSLWDSKSVEIKQKYRANLVKRIGEEAVQNLERVEKYWKNQLFKSWRSLFSEIYKKYKDLNDKIFAEHKNRDRKAENDESWKKWKEENE